MVTLSVPLSDIWIDIRFTLPSCTVDGGMPVVTVEDASTAMRSVLAIAAGVDGPDALPPVHDNTAKVTVDWDPEQVADHTGVTATFGAPLAPGMTLVPDALVGRCWPAVFAAIGSAATDDGFPVVEGLLSLVHLDHAAHLLMAMPKTKAELTVTATTSAATDTEYGRVIPVAVAIADAEGTVLATLEERFAIRGRTGAAELADPPRAGGAITDNATDTPRRRRRDVTVTAPTDMSAFAVVSGDHNPIHTDRAAALLAGLKSRIVHGMWLSAAAQHVVTATDGKPAPPARVVGWTSRFLGMVLPGDEIDFRVDRVGIDRGAEIIEVAARVGSELVMSATAQLEAPKTVYAFPGQGIQHKGMGMEVRARSKAARKVWDTADKFTRDTLGFSVLHVVRDNPTSLIASGVHYHHPDGVLFLTQFTQVAMATVAAAQVAEMREQGAFVEGAIACGHSVGEYTALACVSGVYELEALLEVVFHRGSKMHDIVPRDHLGRSNYRLAAIRPSQIDLDDADVKAFVADIAASTGEFLEIVNFNLRGSQYAIAGTVRGLEALEEEVERRREITGGKRSFILVPGIDVPFHSSVLRVGVADFRRSLERVMPRDKDPDLIIGKYIPNLVPRPFTLDRDFIQEIRDLVPAEPLDEILADYDTWRNEKPAELCRKIVIELLAWQFASPVRWIETQDLLFIEEAAGGLGIERFVEIGVKSAPTVAGLATNTLKLPEYSHNTTEVLNSERDAAVLFATDTDPEPDAEEEEAPAPVAEAAPVEAAAPAAPAPAPAAPSGGPRPDDIGYDAADATMALIALSAKMRIDQIEPLDSIESITDGASSRRNQLLVDLGSELNLGAIDGAAEADLAGLKGQVTKLARTYKPFGPVLSDAINDQLRTVLGPSGKRPAYIGERVKKTWELGDGWVKHVTVEVALGTREGSSVRGGALGRPARRCARRRGDRRQGHRRCCRGGGRAPGCTGVAAVGCRRWGRRGGLRRAGRVRRTGHRPQRRAGLGGPPDPGRARPGQAGQRARGHRRGAHRPGHRRTRFGLAAFGGSGVRRPQGGAVRRPLGQRPRGPGQAVGARRERDRRRLAAPLGAVRGRRERRRHAGHLVAGQGPGRGSQRPRLAVRACRGRRGEPGQGSLHRRGRGRHRCVQGIHRRVGGGPVARRRCDGHRDDVQARRRPVGVLPHPLPRQRPLRREAVGGARQHGVLHRHRRAGFVGRHRADRKPWAAVDSPQGRPDADAAVPVRGAAGGR